MNLSIKIPDSSWIDGKIRDKQNNLKLRVSNKFTEDLIAEIKICDEVDIQTAIESAEKAFHKHKNDSPFQRAERLRKMHVLLEKNKESFAQLIMLEAGKPIAYAQTEVERAIFTLKLAAEEASRISGEQIISSKEKLEERLILTSEFPVGPVLGITPFNFPLNLAMHKLAPALAAGCSIVIKAPPQTPLTMLAFAQLATEAGLENGLLNVVVCENELAEIMVRSDVFKLLSFTGSDKVGWHLKNIAGKKKVLLELGGNAPLIIHDVKNLTELADKVAKSVCLYAGQICISTQRIILNKALKNEFMPLLEQAFQAIISGDPQKSSCVNGPLIDKNVLERLQKQITDAIEQGANLICGGFPLFEQGNIYTPTLIDNVKKGIQVRDEEVFAPIAVIEYFDEFDEALKIANDSNYGLQVGVYTNDLRLAKKAFAHLDYGTVLINEIPGFRLDNMPYGGIKNSGLGREGVRYAIREMTETKVWVM
jgi:acyl-CoA reductase-like NAD-dependent aldehyde dehydrogenase